MVQLPGPAAQPRLSGGAAGRVQGDRHVHWHGDASDPDDLEAVDAAKAKIIIILAEHVASKRSDEITYDILARLREMHARGRMIAECVHSKNRDRLRRAGAEVVMRPIRF